jgi:sodium/bile acid cotransporter 7
VVKIWWRRNWFPVMIFVAVGVGLAVPGLGVASEFWRPELVVKVAVFVIFFLQGMVLPLRELAGGLLLWRFHGTVLFFNFLFAPGLAWIFFAAPWSPFGAGLIPGFLYLGLLPTTISSAVALTVASRGNSAAALFGVTLSNLLGVVMVPVGIVWWMSVGGADVDLSFGDAFRRVAQLIAFPMALGQVVRVLLPVGAKWAGQSVGGVSQGLIVTIVGILFAQSAAGGAWAQFSLELLLATSLGVIAYFVALSGLFWWISKALSFAPGDRIAAYYCATQKGLATGAPMATAFFLTASDAGNLPPLGLILLPLMLYHPLQLTVGSFLAARLRARMESPS